MKEPISLIYIRQQSNREGEEKQEVHLENNKITSENRNENKKSHCQAL